MLFGAHVKQTGGLEAAVALGEARGLEVIQVFTQSPRRWAPTSRDTEALSAIAARRRRSPVVQAWLCHATYLINLAAPDPQVYGRSRSCLVENLKVATAIGSEGLVLHIGSHVGAGFEARLPAVATALRDALDEVEGCPRILLENAAGAGGTVGRTFDELARVVDALDGDERLGVCLDSQHLWASGIAFGDAEEMNAVVESLDTLVGVERLRCLHVNDSKVPFGSNRDRHANLGDGDMGEAPLRAFLGHPAFEGLPALLEMEGFGGDGADQADMEVARRLHEEGRALYR
ncbi:MAG TPA: deoxyribonuclease IV [Acidimicrobiales bacterium]|nr:deoxyribonuclease IV [Acidimicrobiales bacterium]